MAGPIVAQSQDARNYAIQLTGGSNTVGTGGTITGGMAVLSGASLQPALNGSTPGTTLAVTGPVAFASGSFYNVRITPTVNDSVTSTGAAILTGATVNVLAGQGTYATGTRTILTATGSLCGTTFAGVTANLAFLMPTLSYDANDVFLTITGNAANGSVDYRTAASTQNQLAVASGLTAASNVNGGAGPILNALNQLTVPARPSSTAARAGSDTRSEVSACEIAGLRPSRSARRADREHGCVPAMCPRAAYKPLISKRLCISTPH